MALLALVSARSPGLTTTALALAASWPRRVMLAELDPDGGTIAASRAASPDPGLKTLAASGRHYLSAGLIESQIQTLPGGMGILMSPQSPDRCAAALAALNPVGLGETLRGLDGWDVIADCGRIDSNSPALPVVQEADAVVFVLRPRLVDILGLRARLETLELRPHIPAGIVVVREGPHVMADVAAAFEVPVVGTLEWDPRAATALAEGRRLPGRSKLVQSAERLAAQLAAHLEVGAPAVRPDHSEADVPAAHVAVHSGDARPVSEVRVAAGAPSADWNRPANGGVASNGMSPR